MLALSVYALYLVTGWLVLARGIKYPPLELRREVSLNGVDLPVGDRFFDFLLAIVYLFILNIWPVAAYRKIRKGHVVGEH